MSMDIAELYKTAVTEIEKIDAELDAAEGGKAAGKRAIRNKIIAEHSEEFGPIVSNMATSFESLTVVQKIAMVGLVTKLLNSFDSEIDTYLTAQVPETPEGTVTLSDEEKVTLSEKRKALWSKVKSLVDIIKGIMGEEVAEKEYPVPARRNVSSGPRGKQALSTYEYSLVSASGEDIELDEDAGLNEIAKKYGFEKSAALKAAFRESASWVHAENGTQKGIDTSKPPTRFEFTFENGDVLVAAAPIVSE